MPSRWDAATHGWSRRVFHYPLPTLMSRNFRLPCTIELQPLSLTPLKMRKVELFTAVETITDENGDYDIDRLFELASGLHINFYENWYGAGRVTRGLGDVKTFLDKLESLIDPK